MMTMGKPLKMGGTAWRYLTDSVTPEVGQIPLGSDSARYYAAAGTPPGRFLGRGLAGLGDGVRTVVEGDQVSEAMLHDMLARLADPVTGEVLGRKPATGKDAPVAGFDLTFSPPKSVSVVWAMADTDTKAAVQDVCVEALGEVLSWAEDHVFRTRTGSQGIRSEPVRGVVASAWMHYESRDGDPQLHHHVVVLNRAQTASDGRWRTLDSRGLHRWVVALSERHVGLVEDLMTERFGLGWEETATLAGRAIKREVAGVAPDLVAEFSRRTEAIECAIAEKVAGFEETRGRAPNAGELGRIHRVAWGETRRAKTHRSLAAMTVEWTERARPWVGEEPQSWVASLAGRSDLPALRSEDLANDMVADVGRAALWTRAETRSVFSRANVAADVERQLHGVRFARGQRARVADRAVAAALALAVNITPPEVLHVPDSFRSPDGSSQLRPPDAWRYTTQELLDAEARLLETGRNTTGPRVAEATVAAVCDADLPGRSHGLGTDQAVAVEAIATSGRALDLLVGPAGSGKTTALAGLLAAWEYKHGPGSVIGLAPSASAAANLAGELGIACDNTAKWLTELDRQEARWAEIEHLRTELGDARTASTRRCVGARLREQVADFERWQLRAGQLVLLDEAGMAGTLALDRLVAHVAEAGAKVVLVGDWAQLDAVDAGGALAMLVGDRDDAPELSEIRRFSEVWERQASVALRVGSPLAVDAYLAHGRVSEGDRGAMLASLYAGWKADVDAGKSSVMIAGDLDTVADLNRRAREERVAAGVVAREGPGLADGLVAGVGDVVVTRRNDRRLRLPDGHWVRNRDRWVVTATGAGGSLTVRRRDGSDHVVLPASYVAEHLELGYASTAYSAQGVTVDTAHALVGVTTTREILYVAATRGRDSNRLYVDVMPEPAGAEMTHGPAEALDVREVLVGVAASRGADLSAHQTMRTEWAEATSFERLVQEHQTLVAAATAQRWEPVLQACGLPTDELARARESIEWPGLLGAMRDAASRGLDVEAVIGDIATGQPIGAERDPAAVLRARLHRWASAAGEPWQGRTELVAGLVPRASGIDDDDLAQAIRQREEAIAGRALALAEDALATGARWVQLLGPPPQDPAQRGAFIHRVAQIAAYRDRGHITDDSVIGQEPGTDAVEQVAHRNRTLRPVENAVRRGRTAHDQLPPGAPSEGPQPTMGF